MIIFTNIQITLLLRKFFKITARLILSILALLLFVWLLIQTSPVQNWIVGKVTKRLSKDLNTEVSIKHVKFSLFNSADLQGTLIKDLRKDTLLYSENLKVRLTDWFFFKDTLILKFVGLEDAKINLYRKDSVWNYQFIVDHFSSGKPADTTQKSTLKFNLQKIDFKNVSLVQNDLWIGQKMDVKFGSLQLDAEDFDLDKNNIQIREIDLIKPLFTIQNFDGLKPETPQKKAKPNTGYYFNSGDLRLTVEKLNIQNGTFGNETVTERSPYPYFDGVHLRFDKINGSISNISFIKDTIRANVDLATKERSGFELRKLKANFKLTPQIMEFSKLDLITAESHLKDYYAMSFKDFNKDFGDYVYKVKMHAHFTNSEIDSDDLAYFAPEVKRWKKRISIAGNATGTVDNLEVKDLFVRAGNNTTVSGNLTMVGLPDIETTTIGFTSGNLQTNYSDATTFIPAVATIDNPSLVSLGTIKFNGNFNGTIYKFRTAGTFSTNLGGFSSDVTMNLPAKGLPAYDGHVVTKQFNIGKFLKIPNVGTASFDGLIKGQGLDINTLRTTISGKIQQLNFNDYNFKNIIAEGTFQRKQFDGSLKIDDENLNFTSAVKIDLRNQQPIVNVLGDLVNSNFQNLQLTNKRFELSGLFDLNFSGKNIDQFLGSVKVFNATLLADSVRLNFDSLSLQSNYALGQRSLLVKSNEFDAAIEGEYNILDLPVSFQLFLRKYYPAYINEPRTTPKNQKFSFNLNTKNIDGYTQLLDKDLSGFSNSHISGNINTIDTIFSLNADVPDFAYSQYRFTNTNFKGTGNLNNLQLNGEIGLIAVKDSTTFPNTKIDIVSQKDLSQISIQTKANNTLNELNLNTDLYTLKDGVRIYLKQSDFIINDKKWNLEKEGEIIIRKNFVSADKVRFTQGDQEIALETQQDEEFNKTNLVVRLRNLNIGDFSPFITKDPRLEGIAGGEVVLKDFYGKFQVEGNIKAEQFRLDNDSVGIVLINGGYNAATGKINFNVTSPNDLYNFTSVGSYNLKDSLSAPLNVTMNLNNTKIDFVNRFLGSVFENITGFATGSLNMRGDPNSPILTGKVSINKGGLLVKFTRVRYTIDSAYFVFEDNGINFGNFNIKDKFGNVGTVKGKLFEKGFKDMNFNFDISTNKMLLIDTKSIDNPSFYGTAIGKASVTLRGSEEDMQLKITGEPTDSSHIFIPTTTSRESGEADFITFKQYGTEMKKEVEENNTNISVDLDLNANPLAKIDVILDEATGDIIKATGNGRLKIHAGTTEALTINGRYDIQEGSYDFNFQSFIRKPFILKEDAGSYIEWKGDPYNAKMMVEALYVAENVRLGDLVANQNLGGAVQGSKEDVYVYATISGDLKKPDIKFRLDFPAGSQVKNEDSFVKLLNILERDENEMLKQVTYLIVFGSFAPYGEGRNLTSNFTTLGVNTISELISKQVNSLVSNILYKITGDRSLQFDVSTSLYNSSSLFSGNVTATNNIDRQQVNFKLGKSLFDNKVLITFGGDLDFRMGSNTGTSQQLGNLQWLPDLTVEIVLSKNRKLRAILFSRNNLDITQGAVGRRSRQGASISYRQDFDNFFGRKINDEKQLSDSTITFKKDTIGVGLK